MAYLSKYIDYKVTHTVLMHFVSPSWMEAPYHGKSALFHVPDSDHCQIKDLLYSFYSLECILSMYAITIK